MSNIFLGKFFFVLKDKELEYVSILLIWDLQNPFSPFGQLLFFGAHITN